MPRLRQEKSCILNVAKYLIIIVCYKTNNIGDRFMIWILLPAYNEEASLPKLLPKIEKVMKQHKETYHIVVVDDGSNDQTPNLLQEYARAMPLTVITHSINRGLGETERDGFEYITSCAKDSDYIVRLDCDDTHDPEYIFTLINKINEGFDVVNGSRFQPGGGQIGVSPYRALVSYSANVFMKVLFNIKGIRDFSCGFRAYRAQVVKDAIRIFGNGFIQLKGLGFTSTLEMIVKLKLLGCRFAEMPFILRYDQKASPSKMVTSITTLGYLTMALLYHWPWGGWRQFYKGLASTYSKSPEMAYSKYSRQNVKRPMICQIGG